MTSYFVYADQAEANEQERQQSDALAEATEALRRIEQRLTDIERRLPTDSGCWRSRRPGSESISVCV